VHHVDPRRFLEQLAGEVPDAVKALLSRELGSTLGIPALREALVEQGFEPGTLSPAAFSKLIREDTARWRKVIQEAGIKAE